MTLGEGTESRRRARVLLIGRGLGLGGMERLLLAQVRSGDRDRFEYAVAFTNEDKDALVPEFEELGIPVHRLSGGRAPWPLAVRALLAQGRFDVVHAHSPLVAAVVRAASRSARPMPRLVYTEHNSWDPYSVPTRWANRLTYRLDDAQFAVSRAAWESVPVPLRSNLTVLDHGIDVESVRQRRACRAASREELGIAQDEIVVGTVANLRPEKNYEGLLRVAARLTADDPRVRFVSIGQGPLRDRIAGEHAELGLGDRFLLLGAQPDATRLMAAFDIFVLASHVEGLPVAFMEARALGLPVVVTAVGGLTDHVSDRENGLLVPPGSDDALLAALEQVVESDALRARLGEASAGRADDLDARVTVKVIEHGYTRALESS